MEKLRVFRLLNFLSKNYKNTDFGRFGSIFFWIWLIFDYPQFFAHLTMLCSHLEDTYGTNFERTLCNIKSTKVDIETWYTEILQVRFTNLFLGEIWIFFKYVPRHLSWLQPSLGCLHEPNQLKFRAFVVFVFIILYFCVQIMKTIDEVHHFQLFLF